VYQATSKAISRCTDTRGSKVTFFLSHLRWINGEVISTDFDKCQRTVKLRLSTMCILFWNIYLFPRRRAPRKFIVSVVFVLSRYIECTFACPHIRLYFVCFVRLHRYLTISALWTTSAKSSRSLIDATRACIRARACVHVCSPLYINRHKSSGRRGHTSVLKIDFRITKEIESRRHLSRK